MRCDPFELVGTTIAGKYAVEAVVDEGGFSVIYRARHVIWNRRVAIKAFKAMHAKSDEERAQLLRAFVQEGALLADLSERGVAVCQARDVATLITPRGDWVPFMVLEWLEGESLEAMLAHERRDGDAPRTLMRAIDLLAPIADALSVAHQKRIAHRDLKPGNVFVLCDPTARAGIKLLDFGIAKVCAQGSAVTRSFARSFTPSYGAPEQFAPHLGGTGPWTDVFAFALILVELVTGYEPLDGPDVDLFASQALDRKKRPTPRMRGALLGDEVEAVFARALAVDPSRRYANVGAFWRALVRAARRSPEASAPRKPPRRIVVAPHPGGSAMAPMLLRVTRRARRKSVASAAIALAAIALVLATRWPHDTKAGPVRAVASAAAADSR
jgi:serine/threonine protein kinase